MKKTALNCKAYNTFSTAGSDHRIVTAKLRLSLKQSKSSTNKKVRYNWNKLLTNNNIKEIFTVEVNNRFRALQKECKELKYNLYQHNLSSGGCCK